MIDAFQKAKVLLGDKGYDADWFRAALGQREIIPCTPSKANLTRSRDLSSSKLLYGRMSSM
jgi:hypothetical protein